MQRNFNDYICSILSPKFQQYEITVVSDYKNDNFDRIYDEYNPNCKQT